MINFCYSCNIHTLACVNVDVSDFYSKLCAEISEEEMCEMKTEITRYALITNRQTIKKIWDACLEHGYILPHNDYLGFYAYTLELSSEIQHYFKNNT